MTESYPTQNTDSGNSDIPQVTRPSAVDTLPEQYVGSHYVTGLAAQYDRAIAEVDQLRADRNEMHDQHVALIQRATEIESERNSLRARCEGQQKVMNLVSWVVIILGALYAIAYFVSVVTV